MLALEAVKTPETSQSHSDKTWTRGSIREGWKRCNRDIPPGSRRKKTVARTSQLSARVTYNSEALLTHPATEQRIAA
jgi:hypothetical protein